MANELITSPNQLGSGDIPAGYSKVEFRLSDGNWVKEITLPNKSNAGDVIIIKSSAMYSANINASNIHNAVYDKIPIVKNGEWQFTYKDELTGWDMSGKNVQHLTPNNNGAKIANNDLEYTYYSLSNGNWVPEVILPEKAIDNAIVIVESKAKYTTKISHTNMMYKSTTTLKTNESYTFRYLKNFNGWIIHSSTPLVLRAGDIKLQMPSTETHTTIVQFWDGNFIPEIKLPATSGDRDKIILKSTALYTANIQQDYINNPAAMKLCTNDIYEFIYIKENNKWELISYPSTTMQAKELKSDNVPSLIHPRTYIYFSNGNYRPTIILPNKQIAGTRLIVESNADYIFSVKLDNKSVNISKGEIVAFKVNANQTWSQETQTISLLMLYSDKVVEKLGEKQAREREIEGLKLTNEALENSGANFRFKCAALKEYTAKSHWKALGDPLSELRDDPVAQSLKKECKANGIYYTGTEDGCGLAYVKASNYNMVATGSINCGVTVMRHELGHNMGLAHGGESSSYNQGYLALKTIMAGNDIPYYSTSLRYTPDYGIPLGIVDKIDGVRAMNDFSSTVVKYT